MPSGHSLDDIRVKGTRIGIESILHEYSNPKLVMKRSRAFRRPYPAKALTPRNNPKRMAICPPGPELRVYRGALCVPAS